MIYDSNSGALYSDDGSYLKTVHCPMALKVRDLHNTTLASPDKFCHSCKKTIKCADEWTDADMKEELEKDNNLCIFATSRAQNIVFLRAPGFWQKNYENLPVVRTARSFAAMQDGISRGDRLQIMPAGPTSNIGDIYSAIRNISTGNIIYQRGTTHGRDGLTEDHDWEFISEGFLHRPGQTFPFAAYLIPADVLPGQRVFVEDLIEDVISFKSNNGDSTRRNSCSAIWLGYQLKLEDDGPAEVCG